MPKIVQIIETVETEINSPPPTPSASSLTVKELQEIIRPKRKRYSERCLRFITIVVYLFALSGVGVGLSFYYVFFWDSKMPPVFKPKKHLPY